jgi:hypothetical protein
MTKRLILPALLLAALALAATAAAGSGQGKGKGKGKGHHGKFGPYDVVTDDHGSCGNAWAVDTEKRTFKVRRNNDGSFTLTRYDRGTFLTVAGQSPGACNTKGKHGSTVNAGVKGKFKGYLRGRITGGTFDPNATCNTPDCGFTDVWIAAFFGPSATFSCFMDSKACQFGFQYHARHQGLKFHHWYDIGKGAGTFLKERFHGDIANA